MLTSIAVSCTGQCWPSKCNIGEMGVFNGNWTKPTRILLLFVDRESWTNHNHLLKLQRYPGPVYSFNSSMLTSPAWKPCACIIEVDPLVSLYLIWGQISQWDYAQRQSLEWPNHMRLVGWDHAIGGSGVGWWLWWGPCGIGMPFFDPCWNLVYGATFFGYLPTPSE